MEEMPSPSPSVIPPVEGSLSSSSESSPSGVNPEQWEKFSRLTPVASVAKLWAFVAVLGFSFGKDLLSDDKQVETLLDLVREYVWLALLIGLGVIVVFSILSTVVGTIIWYHKSFAIVEDGVHMRSGVFVKKHQHLRWDRVQSVDVDRPFISRILQRSSVKVESGGGVLDDKIVLGLLAIHEAEALRVSILEASNEARENSPVRIRPWRGAYSAAGIQDSCLYELQVGRQISALLRSGTAIFGVIGLIVSVAIGIMADGFAPIAVIFTVFGALVNGFKNLNKTWGAKVYLTREGIRVRAGLTSLYTTTVLPERINSVRLTRKLFWYRKDWWKVEVGIAGQGFSLEENVNLSVVMPVATREEAMLMLWVIFPNLGVDDPRALLREAFEGTGDGEYFVNASRRSRRFDPLSWKRNASAVTQTSYITRGGAFFTSKIAIASHERTQGLTLTSGPLERRRGLASIGLVMPGTVVNIGQDHLEQDRAVAFLEKVGTLSRLRRSLDVRESIGDWRLRVGVGESEVVELSEVVEARARAEAQLPAALRVGEVSASSDI